MASHLDPQLCMKLSPVMLIAYEPIDMGISHDTRYSATSFQPPSANTLDMAISFGLEARKEATESRAR